MWISQMVSQDAGSCPHPNKCLLRIFCANFQILTAVGDFYEILLPMHTVH